MSRAAEGGIDWLVIVLIMQRETNVQMADANLCFVNTMSADSEKE